MAGSFAYCPEAQWSIFRDTRTGRRAAVLANLGRESLEVTGLAMADGATDACTIYQPFKEPTQARWPVSLSIPAERVAFAVEG